MTVYVDAPADFHWIRYFIDVEPTDGIAIVPQNADHSFSLDARALTAGSHRLTTLAESYVRGRRISATSVARFTVTGDGSDEPLVNAAPMVDAGPDLATEVGQPVALVGSASDDGLPTPLTVRWSLEPTLGDSVFSDPGALQTNATFHSPGTYTVRLSANDGLLVSYDDITVVVTDSGEDPSPDEPPGEPEHPDEPVVPGDPEPPGEPTGPSPDYDHFRQIYVSVSGDDSGDGSEARPLRTIRTALRRAYDHAKKGTNVRVLVMPGTYREAITDDYWDSRATIVVEAYRRHAAVISGSDLFKDWTCSGSRCEHAWPYDWGASPNPWPGTLDIGELALRRELVLVEGQRLDQVLAEAQLSPGTFFVDELRNRLILSPPPGVNVLSSGAEVAVRPALWRTQGLRNLVLDGLVFQHAASPFRGSAVEVVDQEGVWLRNLRVVDNGQNGLHLNGRDLRASSVEISSNGSSGLSGYRVVDSRIEDVVVEGSNWRGYLGGYTGWEVGNKFFNAHRVTFTGLISRGNLSRGLWLDTDNADIVIEDARLCGNLLDGIFVELNQGPIVIRDSVICDNGGSGILTSVARGLEVVGSTIVGNEKAQLRVSGEVSKSVRDFETGETFQLSDGNWTIVRNEIAESGGGRLVTTTLPPSAWSTMVASSHFDYNSYGASSARQFQLPDGSRVDIAEWRTRTGLDGSSTFAHQAYAMAP